MDTKYKKLCLYCEHFVFQTSSPHYSDVTPGQDAEMYCSNGYWNIDEGAYIHSVMLYAEYCKDYYLDEWCKKKYGLEDDKDVSTPDIVETDSLENWKKKHE